MITEAYRCEFEDWDEQRGIDIPCPKKAAVEVHSVDEDGDTYSGYYCEEHIPSLDGDEEVIEL